MQIADTVFNIYKDRGSKDLPLERVYRQLFNPKYYLQAYGKLYRNKGAMTSGSGGESVDSMTLEKVHRVIDALKAEKFRWRPVRRVNIPKRKGGQRPLGLPDWSEKVVQEVIRMLLDAYYEPKFSDHSHGFRQGRGCHSALREIFCLWRGSVWFIEGDIANCFGEINHDILLEIIARDIHDNRLLRLIRGMLKAGYLEDGKRHNAQRGVPQGGVASPIFSNIYLNELDWFVENTLIPAYTRGKGRRVSREWGRLYRRASYARQHGNFRTAKQLEKQYRQLRSLDPMDPDFRRLRFVRYADDFLLGFIGPRSEAEQIRQQLSDFLARQLRLTLSAEKTLITHAASERARFLGYEIGIARSDTLVSEHQRKDQTKVKRRAVNGNPILGMPFEVIRNVRKRFCKDGKPTHKAELLGRKDADIVQSYQSIMRGLYNYYCMAPNVSSRMSAVRWMLGQSLVKTLAAKHKCTTRRILKKYQTITEINGRSYKVLRVVMERPGKDPLVSEFGGIPFVRIPLGLGQREMAEETKEPKSTRSEAVTCLIEADCAICGARDPVEMHHIRKLADLKRNLEYGWAQIMYERRRKFLPVCQSCHGRIHKCDRPNPRQVFAGEPHARKRARGVRRRRVGKARP